MCMQSLLKRLNDKELHIVPFWEEYAECILI
jgi:hypothetical protein